MNRHGDITNMPDGLRDHLESCDANEREGLVMAWNMAGNLDSFPAIDLDRKAAIRKSVLEATATKLERTPVLRPVFRPERIFSFRTFSMAATIVFLIGMSFVLAPRSTTIRVPADQVDASEYVLPDGSTVILAAGSVLSYSTRFGDRERRVVLPRGEAFFDVVKDGSPFYVDSYNTRTSVLGTRFLVTSQPDGPSPSTEIRVQQGLVSVESRTRSSEPVRLLPGQGSHISESSVVSVPFDMDDQGFAYSNKSIGYVLSDLSRRFEVELTAPASIRLRRIYHFQQATSSINDVLEEITATIGVRYRAVSNGFELYLQ